MKMKSAAEFQLEQSFIKLLDKKVNQMVWTKPIMLHSTLFN